MKFCYFDESGNKDDAVNTMVGVMTDATRMHLTKAAWLELLDELSKLTGHGVREMHANQFYSGSGIWRQIDGPDRADIITVIIDWMRERKHHITFSAIDLTAFAHTQANDERLANLTTWSAMGFHSALALQRCNQKEDGPKGHTVLVFDEKVHEKDQFTDLLLDPPDWSDEYYSKERGQERLDQIVDVPHFVDSKKVPLVQVADVYAFFLRRFFELEAGYKAESYAGERDRVSGWANGIFGQAINNSHLYPKKKPTDTACLFRQIAPAGI